MAHLVPQTIETPRLLLRPFRHEDWQELYAYYSDPEAIKYVTSSLSSEADTWRIMASMVGHWTLRGYGPYAIELKETGELAGLAGLWFPNDWPSPEIKWGLIRKFWGQKIASEAARAVKKMAGEYIPDLSLISMIQNENLASIQLAKAIGATFEKEVDFRGGKWSIYRHKP